jgi:hypothetical protein
VVTEDEYKQAAARLAVARSRLEPPRRPRYLSGWYWFAIVFALLIFSGAIGNVLGMRSPASSTPAAGSGAASGAAASGQAPAARTCPTAEQVAYFTSVQSGSKLASESFAALTTQFGRLGSNALLFLDQDWRIAVSAALVGMQLGADKMLAPAAVPGLEQIDRDIDVIAREEKTVAAELAAAIDALDPKRVEAAGARLNSNRTRMEALAGNIENFCK